MIVPLEHNTWQLLRALVRAEAEGTDLSGAELRVAPTRRTKDGTFLDELVHLGLIVVSAKAPPLPRGSTLADQKQPAQFRTRYKLTPKGRHAAEYGEYDRPHTPQVTELTGLAAEVFGKAAGGAKKTPPAKTREK